MDLNKGRENLKEGIVRSLFMEFQQREKVHPSPEDQGVIGSIAGEILTGKIPSEEDEQARERTRRIHSQCQSLFGDAPPLCLLAFDADKIKAYVFESPKPLEVRGASYLLEQFNEIGLKNLLEGKGLSEGNIIFSGGGSGLLLLPAYLDKTIEEWINASLAEKTYTATVTCATEKVFPEELIYGKNCYLYDRVNHPISQDIPEPVKFLDFGRFDPEGWEKRKCFGELVAFLSQKLRRNKEEKALYPFYEAIPLAKRCASCGIRPAQTEKRWGEDHLCESCYRKRETGRDRLRGLSEEEAKDFSYVSDENKYIGIIYSDGNNMGSILERLENIYQYKVFSEEVTQIFDTACQEVVNELNLLASGKYQRPIMGGDDILLILPGNLSLEAAEQICQKIEDKFSSNPTFEKVFSGDVLEDLKKMDMATGIIIAHHKFPILYLVDYAEALMKLAKEKSYSDKTIRSCLDFMVITDSSPINISITKLREKILQKEVDNEELHYTSRPYSLKEFSDFLTTLKSLKKSFPRTQLYILRESLTKGRAISELNLLYQYIRSQDGLRKWVDESLGWDSKTLPRDPMTDMKRLREFLWKKVVGMGGKDYYSTQIPDLIEAYKFIRER